MNLTYRKKPYSVLTYEALFRRLLPQYRKNKLLRGKYLSEVSGYIGEKNVDYKLSLYPFQDTLVIQGIRLNNGSHNFQIDTLILSKYFICILEVKNYKGTVEYDSDFKQFIQIVGDEKKGYRNPIFQAEAQKGNLDALLQEMQIYDIPIDYLVVISDPRTILKNSQGLKEVFDKIIHAESLPIYLNKMREHYKKEVTSKSTINKIYQSLLKMQAPLQPQLLNQFQLTDRHLVKGVPYPICQRFPMVRSHRTWLCKECLATNKNAHKQVLYDYFLLQNSVITNKKCTELLHLNSGSEAYTILNSMGLKHSGKNKGRHYLAPLKDDYPQDSFVPIQNKRLIFD